MASEVCEVDDKPIEMMAFKGTGVCSEICRKVRDREIDYVVGDHTTTLGPGAAVQNR